MTISMPPVRALGSACRALAVVALVLAGVLLTASSAAATFSIAAFNVSSTSTLAGGHPDLTTELRFSTTSPGPPRLAADGNVRDIEVRLPPGLVGDPSAVPQCTQGDFSAGMCPPASQIGSAVLTLITSGLFPFNQRVAVFNVKPRNPEETAEIGFAFGGFLTVHMPLSVRTDGDYGLTAQVTGTSRIFAVGGVALTLWGVPGDPAHDPERMDMRLNPVGPSQVGRAPFLVNPSQCDVPLAFSAKANSYQDVNTYSNATALLPELTGCDVEPFDPALTLQPVSRVAGAPSAYESVLTVPETISPEGQATASLRKAVVTLPRGVAISPSGAVGLGGCDDADLNLRSTAPASCPDSAKIGSVVFDVPVLADPIHGSIYLRRPLPGDLFRLVLVADDFGIHLKIPADVHADPLTGQLTATFTDTPQVPLRKLTLSFDGGSHAALVNPPACGTYKTSAQLTPWSSSTPVVSESSFTIDQGCGRENAFAPEFSAGTGTAKAGALTSFHLRITKDGGQALSTVNTTLPPGLLGVIGNVPRCPEPRAAMGTCGAESQVGHTVVGAGAGSDPIFLPQPGKAATAVYLAGPYKGAPFSLSIVVPAQAGPFDLGTVVVRAGLHVDPVTAQVTVQADPLPTILEGIPLNLRDVRVDVDRPGFMFNPTNCDQQAVTGTLTSAGGQATTVASPFRVVDCDALDLTPELKLGLSGKGQTTDGKHPTLTATLKQPRGQSNLKKVEVRLPLSLALDPENSQSDDLCEFVDGRKTIPQCPASSIVGTATARTPVLDQPLVGPVYFIKNVRTDPKSGRQIRTLPTLATVLRGEGVTLVLRASSTVVDEALVTTFDNLPDAPVSDFKLSINGGKKGILIVSGANICRASQVADAVTTGQNGKSFDDRITTSTPCPLGVISSSHTATKLNVKVGGIGAGKVSASGKGLKTTTRTVSEATVATLSLRMSAAMRESLAQGHDVQATVKVSFTPVGGKKARKITKHLVIHGTKR